jgi:hypothetical protein
MRYSLLVLSVLMVVSCTKKGEETKSRQEILRESRWSLDTGTRHDIWKKDGVTVLVDVNQQTPITKPECALDDRLVFREGYDGAHIPGDWTCSINETAEMQFKWGLIDNDSRIYIYDANEFFRQDVNADILEFYNDKFTIRYYELKDKLVDDGMGTKTWVRDSTIYTMTFMAEGAGG